MTLFCLTLGLRAAANEAPAKRLDVLFLGTPTWLETELPAMFEALVEAARPNTDVRVVVRLTDGREQAKHGDSLAVVEQWVTFDAPAIRRDLDTKLAAVEATIAKAKARKKDPAPHEVRRAALQARRADLDGRSGWTHVVVCPLHAKAADVEARLCSLAREGGARTVRLLRFGGFAHGKYYGNKHYLKDIAGAVARDVEQARGSKDLLVSSVGAAASLFQENGEHAGPYNWVMANKLTWAGSYLVACHLAARIFDLNPVGAWQPAAVAVTEYTVGRDKKVLAMPLDDAVITAIQNRVWREHARFVEALGADEGKESTP